MEEPERGVQRALPVLIALGGQVATGKSTIAQGLAQEIGAALLEADRVHDELLAGEPRTAGWQGFTEAFEGRVYAELLRRASGPLAAGRHVVLDACFPLNLQRLEARSLARRSGAAFLFAECEATEQSVRQRLAAREAQAQTPGWWEIRERLRARWEAVAALAEDETLRVRGDASADEATAAIRRARCLRPWSSPRRRPLALPRAVTFDCWNTLLYEADWETAVGLRVDELHGAARVARPDLRREDAARAFDVAWRRHQELWCDGVASGSREIALWGLAELGVADPEPAAFAQLVQLFEEMSHSGRVLALDGAADTLAALARAGVPCALVCDTGLTPGRVVRAHLEHLGLLRSLSAQVFSDEIGVPKPDPRAFRAALAALGAAPEESVHVGDLRRTDVVGARALGMTAVRIRDRHDDASPLCEADHVVGCHADLRALLGLG